MAFRINDFYFKLVFTIRTWFIYPVAMMDYFDVKENKIDYCSIKFQKKY
jgi:hypothetical protein